MCVEFQLIFVNNVFIVENIMSIYYNEINELFPHAVSQMNFVNLLLSEKTHIWIYILLLHLYKNV